MEKIGRREFLITAAKVSPLLLFPKYLLASDDPKKEPSVAEAAKPVETPVKKAPFKKATIKKTASYLRKRGFGKDYIDGLLSDERVGVEPDLPQFKKRDPSRPKMTYKRYRELFNPEMLALEGAKFYYAQHVLIDSLEKETGVPKELALSILGIESIYGKRIGDFHAISTLLTLIEKGRRSVAKAGWEIASLLKIGERYGKDPLEIMGSWESAIGPPQFMPSTLLMYDKQIGAGSYDELFSMENSIRLVFAYLGRAGATESENFPLHGRNYKAAMAYNHDSKYARLAMETAQLVRFEIVAWPASLLHVGP